MSSVLVTLQVVDGPDRGKIFEGLRPTIKIGREEGNTVRLRDDRASRFHAKIHEDAGEVLITDLESTNGTWVNGEPVQIAPLSPGDRIMIGRSVLVVYYTRSPQQSADATSSQPSFVLGDGIVPADVEETSTPTWGQSRQVDELAEQEERTPTSPEAHQADLPPDLPDGLTPGQTARFARIFDFLHRRIAPLMAETREEPGAKAVILSHDQWQQVVELAWLLSDYYRKLVEPRE